MAGTLRRAVCVWMVGMMALAAAVLYKTREAEGQQIPVRIRGTGPGEFLDMNVNGARCIVWYNKDTGAGAMECDFK